MQIKRREFLGFFLVGSLVSFLGKKVKPKKLPPREALFWRRKT